MHKSSALCLVLLSLLAHAMAQACTGSVVAVEVPGEWDEHNIPKRIFELHITNTATCTIRDSLQLTVTPPTGSHVGYSWGMTPSGVVNVPSISAGQTYSGVGFIFIGIGTPSVTIESFGTCDCGTASTTGTPTDSPTSPPTDTPTNPPTDAPTTSPTDTPTDAPTTSPTTTPTDAPTTSPTTTPTGAPTVPPGSFNVNMRYLVLAENFKAAGGLDVVNLTFNSVGSQFDVVEVAAATDLTSLLSTSGVGKYSGIVIMKKSLLSAAQTQLVNSYQQYYGVRSAYFASAPTGLAGLAANGAASSVLGTLTLAPEAYAFAHPIQHAVSINTQKAIAWQTPNPATVTPASITDATIATPVIYYNGNLVAVAATTINGTQQLHYFLTQSADYFFSRLFAPILLNWLSPGGIYLGQRRVTLAVQPDDLFLASNLWDIHTHKNPLSDSLVYRITANDLQAAADFLTSTNQNLPSGSYVTIEWPYNGAGTTWYTQPDALLAKAIAVQDIFYFVSHTWDHPCDFDNATYAEVFGELKNNIDWTNTGVFLTGNMQSPRLSANALVNPCITGLFNGNCLQAMADNGIQYCVGDNSVKALVPTNLYHGVSFHLLIISFYFLNYYFVNLFDSTNIHTTVATHGYAGMFIIPREAYDIDYDNSIPAELVDQFNTENKKLNYTFEKIMDLQLDYAMEKKTGFRNDAFMFHQANLRFFDYTDPVSGTTTSVSLTTMWMDRVIKQTLAYYDLPVVSPQFPVMAKIWLDREALDNCGLTTDLSFSSGKVTGITLATTGSCEVPLSGIQLSGATVRVEQAGAEVTSFVTMTAGIPQSFTVSVNI